jgi:hypothetical protein
MTNGSKLSLFSGVAIFALSLVAPASAAPAGSYQQSCRNIEQHYGRGLSAECRTRDGSWNETRLDSGDCSGDIANNNGRLVCNDGDNNRDNDRDAERNDRRSNDDAYARNQSGERYGDRRDEHYGDRRDNDRGDWDNSNLSRGQIVRRMERQGYMAVRDLRQIRDSNDWRATASWHGRRVIVRLNPRNGRVLNARYI